MQFSVDAPALSVVEFAAEELQKYLKKMLPADCQATISILLKIIEPQSQNTLFVPNVDDWFQIKAKETHIHIFASNSRSVLLGVYRFLTAFRLLLFNTREKT